MATNFVEADTLPILRVFLRNRTDNTPLDLTDVETITLRFEIDEDGASERQMIIGNADPENQQANPTHGVAVYQFTPAELRPGTLTYEVTVRYTDGDVVTTMQPKTVPVRERLR